MAALPTKRLGLSLAIAALTTACSQNHKLPVCTFAYGGEQFVYHVPAVNDPYAPTPFSIAERFSFRGVYLTKPRQVASLNLYVFAELTDGPRLLTQLSYVPPYHAEAQLAHGYGFTGRQRVYAPNDRELEFWCEWGTP